MKKIITIAIALFAVQFANAQNNFRYSPEMMRITASIIIIIVFMVFILAILKRYLDHRLKNKIVDKGVTESIASSILQNNPKEDQNSNIKWFSILAGIGGGLTAVAYTQPLGIHSLAIMSFSVSLSFLGYYFFVNRSNK